MDYPFCNRPRGSSMKPTTRRCRGYSLIELLVVLVIVGILTAVGVMMIGDRRGSGVRSVMDEIEGVLYSAQKASMASSRDIYITTTGTWVDGSLIMDARPLVVPANWAAAGWLSADSPSDAYLTPGTDANRVGASTECFRSRSPRDRDHLSAGVAVSNGWYAAALGPSAGIEAVPPVSTQPDFVATLAYPIFNGAQRSIVISGLSKRFATGFCVVIVGLNSGNPLANGPIGVLVVPRNGSAVYKYYKSDNSSDWRLL